MQNDEDNKVSFLKRRHQSRCFLRYKKDNPLQLWLKRGKKMSHEKKRVISFFITNQCNLACTYCVNDTKNVSDEQSINLDFAKKGIDDFFKNRIDLFGFNNKGIRFYGIGEPTRRIDLVKEITNYARTIRGDNLFVELQTNGFFNKETAKWVGDNVNEVWVSIDGSPKVQNKNRPTKNGSPSSSVVVNNIKYLLAKGIFVGVRPTITAENVDKQIEMLDYFKSIGVSWVYAEPVFESVKQKGSLGVKNISTVNLKEFTKKFVEAYKYAESNDMHYGNFFTVNFDEPCEYACRACLPMPQLTTDGYVSSCDLAYSGKTRLSDFIFGKYNAEKNEIDYSKEKIMHIRTRKPENIKECASCEVKENCGGGCAGLAYHVTGNFHGVVPEFCESVKYLAKRIPRNTGLVKHLHP